MAGIGYWDDERVARLRELLLVPFISGSSIAKRLSREFGEPVTRCAVIGKVRRLKLRLPLEPHIPRNSPRKRPRRQQTAQLSPPRTEPIAPPEPGIECNPCGLLELDSTRCHWPLGDPRQVGFMFCGAPVSAGGYCAGHHLGAFDFGKGSTGSLRWRMRHGSWK